VGGASKIGYDLHGRALSGRLKVRLVCIKRIDTVRL